MRERSTGWGAFLNEAIRVGIVIVAKHPIPARPGHIGPPGLNEVFAGLRQRSSLIEPPDGALPRLIHNGLLNELVVSRCVPLVGRRSAFVWGYH